jgi:hypothetical protein
MFPLDVAVYVPHIAGMDLKAELLSLADAFCATKGMSKARLATLVANDGKFFRRIEGGGGFTVRTHERCMAWFVANWPPGTDWPSDVPKAGQH